ncbi:MAG: chorismate synthase [Deltaproteobacteria bacterium]
MTLRFLTSGESHGEALLAIVEGLPSGFFIDREKIQTELSLRQKGYGRSGRMKIETDTIQILSGIRNGKTIGSPIALMIKNKDFTIHTSAARLETPRPGHADLVGTLKFQHDDIRDTLERASARETAIRTAVGAVCQQFLTNFNISFSALVIQIGRVRSKNKMTEYIKACQKKGESVGGIFEIRAQGIPLGLGNYSQWDLRLDGRLAQAVMSIPAIKGVEIGDGFKTAMLTGSQSHDEIFYNGKNKKSFGFYRKTNRHGGIEGGVTTGEELIIRAAMKPLPTLPKNPLRTVNMFTMENARAFSQRTDSCAVAPAAVIARNVVAIEIAKAFLEKFGGDSFREVKNNFKNYLKLNLPGVEKDEKNFHKHPP